MIAGRIGTPPAKLRSNCLSYATDADRTLLKKLINDEIDHLLFEDESMIRDYQAIGKTWFLRGKQRIIPTYGQHKGVKLIGTLDYETGRILCTEEEKYDAQAFLRFLKKILFEYPTGKIIIVLDNARIHHAKLIRPSLKRIEIAWSSSFWLPIVLS